MLRNRFFLLRIFGIKTVKYKINKYTQLKTNLYRSYYREKLAAKKKNPYYHKSRKPKLLKSFCTFIDILGFSNHIMVTSDINIQNEIFNDLYKMYCSPTFWTGHGC